MNMISEALSRFERLELVPHATPLQHLLRLSHHMAVSYTHLTLPTKA